MPGVIYNNAATGQFEGANGTDGALHTLNQAADGYDASIGRVVTEESNNYAYSLIKTGAVTAPAVKGSPGFIHSVTINGYGTVPQNTCVILYDALTATGTAYIDIIKLTSAASAATGIVAMHIPECSLFTTGLSIGLATHDADGTLTAVSAITGGTYSVGVGIAYR